MKTKNLIVMGVGHTLKYNEKTRAFFWDVWLRDENGKNIHKEFDTKKEAEEYAFSIAPDWNLLRYWA